VFGRLGSTAKEKSAVSSSIAPQNAITRGKVIAVKDRIVVFVPRGTNYQLHVQTSTQYTGPLNAPVDAVIRGTGRKVWSVPSGGNFVAPIVGSPRIAQGRVKQVTDLQVVVHAGPSFLIDLPPVDSAIDLPSGPIAAGAMVNVTLLPGVTFELAGSKAAVAKSATAMAPSVR
jgi:hypothetical protein